MTLGVITGTTGTPYLRQCIDSVLRQTIPMGVTHYIVVDGPEFRQEVDLILKEVSLKETESRRIVPIYLPENTGANRFNAHRIYGSVPFLVNTDYVAYLDEDNYLDPHHFEHLFQSIGKHDWAFSLRTIVNPDGTEVCKDLCESIGSLGPTVCGPDDFLVDVSCFLLKRTLAIALGPLWNVQARPPPPVMEVDRAITKTLLQGTAGHGVSKHHTLYYRLGGNALSVSKDFFLQGNDKKKEPLYVFHLSKHATDTVFDLLKNESKLQERSYALDEWQPTLCLGLRNRFELVNGYDAMHYIPQGAKVLVTMFHPSALPMTLFKTRTDLTKCVYTIESPNIRHQDQWDPHFLTEHFDRVLTYFKPFIDAPPRGLHAVFCPHNTHHLDFDNPVDRRLLDIHNECTTKAVAIVLENRPLAGTFVIGGTELHALDPLREKYARGLKDITCYGVGWDKLEGVPGVKIGHTLHRSKDSQSSVDILKKYTFALICENVDAEGYVSEKMYDALLAGCIPLYYGNVVPELGIPEGLYIDLRKFENGTHLQRYLDALDLDTLALWKLRIEDLRPEILRNVSCQAFADKVVEAFT